MLTSSATVSAVTGERLISELVAYIEQHRAALSDGSSELALNPTCLRYLTALQAQLSEAAAGASTLTPLRQRECRALLAFLGTLKLLRIVPTRAGAVDKVTEFDLAAFRSLAAVEVRGVKLGLIGGWRRVACQLRLVIVHDCLNSLDELLAFDADADDAGDAAAAGEPWGQLQQLSCAENFIPRIDGSLHALTRLERLDLSHNLISRIENTEHCYSLAYLNLGHNRIASVSDINLVLGNVSVLILRDNQLPSMLGLEKLFNLRRLDLSNNRLTDLSELRELGTLPVLEQLWLARNPFTAAPTYRGAVFCAFQQDLVLDGRSPTESERRERAEERELRAAAAVAQTPAAVASSQPVVVARRKHGSHARQRSLRKPAIAVVMPDGAAAAAAAAAPAAAAAATSPVSDPASDASSDGSPHAASLERRSYEITIDALDRQPASPAQQTAYLQELRKEGGAAWLLMMEELTSGDVPDTPATRGALLTRLSAKTKTGSLSRIILPKQMPPAAVATSPTSLAHVSTSPPQNHHHDDDDNDGDDDDDDSVDHSKLSRFASMPPMPSTRAAAPAVAADTTDTRIAVEAPASGEVTVIGMASWDEPLRQSLTALLRKDGDESAVRAVLRSNGLLGKGDDEQRLHVLISRDSLCVFRGEPPTLQARVPLQSLSRLTVSLSHQFCALRYASGESLTLLLRDSAATARWLTQLSFATAHVKHEIQGESAAAEAALTVQRDVLGDAAEPVKLYVLLYRVLPGAKRYTGWLPDGVSDAALQPVSLALSRQSLALFTDGYGRAAPSDVLRFALSDVVSLVLDQTSNGFTVVFDEQAEPQPRRDKSVWRRTPTSHRWTLATQSPAERDKAVAAIAKQWKAIFKIDLVH